MEYRALVSYKTAHLVFWTRSLFATEQVQPRIQAQHLGCAKDQTQIPPKHLGPCSFQHPLQ